MLFLNDEPTVLKSGDTLITENADGWITLRACRGGTGMRWENHDNKRLIVDGVTLKQFHDIALGVSRCIASIMNLHLDLQRRDERNVIYLLL
jgi:hypothetical protein